MHKLVKFDTILCVSIGVYLIIIYDRNRFNVNRLFKEVKNYITV